MKPNIKSLWTECEVLVWLNGSSTQMNVSIEVWACIAKVGSVRFMRWPVRTEMTESYTLDSA